MKHTTQTRTIPFKTKKAPAYPNAAGRKYHISVLLDYLLTVATCVGLTAAFLFMITVL